MRIRIDFDGADTEQARGLLAALSRVGLKETRVHLDGPEKWAGTTESMRLPELLQVVAQLEGHVAQLEGHKHLDRAEATFRRVASPT